jgi:protein gp37
MGKDSKIEWCTHTFNPWRGCTKVSAGCTHCYAETLSHRNPKILGIWGDNGTRVVAAEERWKEVERWNKAAADDNAEYQLRVNTPDYKHTEAYAGGFRWIEPERPRVFCASLADVFEDRSELVEPRARLSELIEDTPHLDWLLLTKRPENIVRLWDDARNEAGGGTPLRDGFGWPGNVWPMTTVENADQLGRIDKLLSAGSTATVLGLSIEPLLGPMPTLGEYLDGIDWVIVGGESGPGARPCHPDWVRSIRDQCKNTGTAFFFKQWGTWFPIDMPWEQDNPKCLADNEQWLNLKGGCGFHGDEVWRMRRVSKQSAGRVLDGRTHDEFPAAFSRESTHAR